MPEYILRLLRNIMAMNVSQGEKWPEGSQVLRGTAFVFNSHIVAL